MSFDDDFSGGDADDGDGGVGGVLVRLLTFRMVSERVPRGPDHRRRRRHRGRQTRLVSGPPSSRASRLSWSRPTTTSAVAVGVEEVVAARTLRTGFSGSCFESKPSSVRSTFSGNAFGRRRRRRVTEIH